MFEKREIGSRWDHDLRIRMVFQFQNQDSGLEIKGGYFRLGKSGIFSWFSKVFFGDLNFPIQTVKT